MTPTDSPSLDDLLRAATPVEAEPFDLDAALDRIYLAGQLYNVPGQLRNRIEPREQIARYISDLRCTIDDRERVAANLEADAARVDARIAEALRWLDMAATYATSEDVAAAIDDAAAALRGGAE